MNKWKIPDSLEREIIKRDVCCVYCGIEFGFCGTRKSQSSWEHITNDARIITRENIALCCVSCNASKGAKLLSDRINSDYCKNKNITPQSVSSVIQQALLHPPKYTDDTA